MRVDYRFYRTEWLFDIMECRRCETHSNLEQIGEFMVMEIQKAAVLTNDNDNICVCRFLLFVNMFCLFQ